MAATLLTACYHCYYEAIRQDILQHLRRKSYSRSLRKSLSKLPVDDLSKSLMTTLGRTFKQLMHFIATMVASVWRWYGCTR